MSADSDKPRRLVYELPDHVGNKHSRVEVVIGGTKFKCKPTLDGITLMEFAGLARSMDTDDPEAEITPKQAAESSDAILNTIKVAFVDYPAFKAFVQEHGLEIEFLTTVLTDLVEAYTDRPTS